MDWGVLNSIFKCTTLLSRAKLKALVIYTHGISQALFVSCRVRYYAGNE